MRWEIPMVVFTILCSGTATTAAYSIPAPDSLMDEPFLEEEQNNVGGQSLQTIYEEDQLDRAVNLLARLLLMPWPKNMSPIVYLDDNDIPDETNELTPDKSIDEYDNFNTPPLKRSRYYRKYPWKRQNTKYDPANRFICNPSKEEVYRLLVALHEARQGNRDRNVDFCNRKRPAYSVYTNIRFIGK